MAWEPDFRQEPMDSPEGKGIARDRYEAFMDEHLEELVAFYLDPYNPPPERHYSDEDDLPDEIPDEVLDKFSERAREESEAIGFWVAWHLAGGFHRLETAGWHRATIYRKLHRFRARYGKHPDEYVFPHIRLNYAGYWEDQIRQEFEPQEPPDPDDLEE